MKPLGAFGSLVTFGIPAAALYAAAWFGIPWITDTTGLPQVVAWFIAGSVVMVPLFVLAVARGDRERLRLRRLSRADLAWAGVGLLVIAAGTAGVIALFHGQVPEAPFMHMTALAPGQRWILLAWLPFFFFNIVGEELFWRGYVLPRQEAAFGVKWAWLINAVLWGVFHGAFGLAMIAMLAPILLVVPWIASRTKNTSVGILLHGAINGGGFLAIALGAF